MKPHADHGFFDNLETSKHNSEREGLQQCRIDERRASEVLGEMELLGDDDDLSQRQRVDQGPSLRFEINMLLGENHGFIDGKQTEHDKKIKGDHQVLPCSAIGSLL